VDTTMVIDDVGIVVPGSIGSQYLNPLKLN